jgi:hypothetical protein
MTDTLFDERRLVSRVLRHWQEMALGRNLPSKDHIDPWLIGDDWSYCMLLSLGGQGSTPTFLTVGAKLLPSDDAWSHRPIEECPGGTIPAAMLAQVERCVAEARPLKLSGGALHLGNEVLFRALLMPLSGDGDRVDGIFGAANFRSMEGGEKGELNRIVVQAIED